MTLSYGDFELQAKGGLPPNCRRRGELHHVTSPKHRLGEVEQSLRRLLG